MGDDVTASGSACGHRIRLNGPDGSPQLERLGFGLVGYGYTTCTENSGPLAGQRECEQFPTG